MVEECMVVANRCAALFLQKHGCAGPFIVHQGFRPDRLDEAAQFLERFAPDLSAQVMTEVAGYREIMSALSATEHELPLRSMVNRLLTRAVLSVAAGPHMGMALPVYTNCTSPLRKYADLLAHRQIKSILRERATLALSQDDLNVIAERIQTARDACLYAERWLVSRYLERITGFKKDCVLSASVAQISSSGLSIRLDGSGLEGFVDLRKDPEKFSFDKWTASLTSTTRRFSLGQSIQVFCRGVDSKSRLAQFDVVEGCGLKTAKSPT
jgi:ribonuclease R